MIGVKKEQAIERFVTQMPVRFETADEDLWVKGVVVELGERRRADSIEQVLLPAPPGHSDVPREATRPAASGGNHTM